MFWESHLKREQFINFQRYVFFIITPLKLGCFLHLTMSWVQAKKKKDKRINAAAAAAKSLQSCPTLCDPIDRSPPGSLVPGILQARTLEWVAISFSNAWKWKVKVKSLSRVWPSATPWTAAFQAPLSMGFSRQEYWSGVPLPSPIYIYLKQGWGQVALKSSKIVVDFCFHYLWIFRCIKWSQVFPEREKIPCGHQKIGLLSWKPFLF